MIALVFFFGVGLAGGTAYKLLSADDSDQQTADQQAANQPSPSATSQPTPQTAFAPPSGAAAASDSARGDNAPSLSSPQAVAPEMAQLAPAAPPSVPPPPAPPADATVTPAPSDSAAAAPPAPVPYAAVAPQTSAATAAPAAPPHVVATHRAAVPPRKPWLAAKAAHQAQVAALHAPPAAPGNAAGPFRVQFGAFANEENARRVQWAVEATGLKVDVTQAPGSSGQPLFYLRSPDFHDYAAALSAAQTVRDRVQHFVNAIPIDYAILGDRATIEQQAQAH